MVSGMTVVLFCVRTVPQRILLLMQESLLPGGRVNHCSRRRDNNTKITRFQRLSVIPFTSFLPRNPAGALPLFLPNFRKGNGIEYLQWPNLSAEHLPPLLLPGLDYHSLLKFVPPRRLFTSSACNRVYCDTRTHHYEMDPLVKMVHPTSASSNTVLILDHAKIRLPPSSYPKRIAAFIRDDKV
ncbi:hypothetical protein J6590_074715 [Homalodisca vitripennis]|nr:hypothetical protein J6590_074715 [Homalodisca vitripennis]